MMEDQFIVFAGVIPIMSHTFIRYPLIQYFHLLKFLRSLPHRDVYVSYVCALSHGDVPFHDGALLLFNFFQHTRNVV